VSAAIALAEGILNRSAGAVEAYLGFLKSGGSKFPLETLLTAGVDMTSAAPVESTLRLFEKRLNELEELLQA
jgi:oligoendopeptidase F